MEYALRDNAERFFHTANHPCQAVSLSQDCLLITVVLDQNVEWEPEPWSELCIAYMEECHQLFYCELRCGMGIPIPSSDIGHYMKRLKELVDSEGLDNRNRMFELRLEPGCSTPVEGMRPPVAFWSDLLRLGLIQALALDTKAYLESLHGALSSDTSILERYYADFLQLIVV
ncbi:hypothetical protein [Cohnella sp. AR92]|uniref:hypothetical protein n=1 Tax=Cohnella sp. AR92 TaxID=648716 RepID=UPI000F8F0C8A|nr:hypothetical protein [Cohnella sp. AR92]RUS44974.1 hypothetical protein ELR57_22225 [Cohnella sp. AR92]